MREGSTETKNFLKILGELKLYTLIVRSSKPKFFKYTNPEKALFYAFYWKEVAKAKKVKIQLT